MFLLNPTSSLGPDVLLLSAVEFAGRVGPIRVDCLYASGLSETTWVLTIVFIRKFRLFRMAKTLLRSLQNALFRLFGVPAISRCRLML